MSTFSTSSPVQSNKRLYVYMFFAALIWLAAYNVIQPLAEWISYTALGLARDSRFGESLAFFLYDVPKILLLLSGMVFAISIVRTFFSPERTRALLGGKSEGVGNIFAALLGIVTPFCSCSAVPLFIGFVELGIPLGVTFSFLIAAPTINEVAIILLFGLFGWKVAGLYIVSGLAVAIIAGFIIGRLKMERYVEDFVWQIKSGGQTFEEKMTWADRIDRAWNSVKEIVGKVWLYVVIGIAVGAGIHGYVPEDALVSILGKQALVVGPRRGADRHPVVFQCGGHCSHHRHVDRKRRVGWDGAGIHDVGHRLEPARSGHLEARFENAAANHVLRRHCHCDHAHRIFIQCSFIDLLNHLAQEKNFCHRGHQVAEFLRGFVCDLCDSAAKLHNISY